MDRQTSKEYSSATFLKVSEFRYPESKNRKPELIYPSMPLNSVREKIYSMGHIDNIGEKGSIMEVPEESRLGEPLRNRSANILRRSDKYKTFLRPRDQTYRPELLIFGRYSYENYSNYAYKNPFRPPAPNIISSQEKPKRRQPFSYNANVETIYYKNRYDDFNRLVEQKLRESRKEAAVKRQQKLSSYRQKQTSRKKSVLVEADAKPYRVRTGTSTLAHLIKEFNVLQKLTQMIETEMHNHRQPLSVNIFNASADVPSESIFLEVLVHRFGWLKTLHKKTIERLFSALNVDNIDRYAKITLKTYVEFIRLFVIRDASEEALSEFLLKFFFGRKQIVIRSTFEEVLDTLEGPESKHQKIREVYSHFFDDPVAEGGFRTFSESNTNAMHWIVDLFIRS